MRKTIAATIIALSLVGGTAAVATADDPTAPTTNAQCQGVGATTNQTCDVLLDWARLNKALQDQVSAQHSTIVHQRAVIKRLRAKLSRAH